MNLKEQEYVCALAENGTITAAAKELFISQPALSIYINNLEKSLGVRLFERVGKQFILTYAGEQYVEKAKLILQLSHELDEKLKDIYYRKLQRTHPHRGPAAPGDRIFAPCYCLLRKGISRSGSDPL